MRKKLFGALLVVMSLFIAGQALAVDPIINGFCVGTSTIAGKVTGASGAGVYKTAAAYVLFAGDGNSQVVITSISGTSDLAASSCATTNMYVYDKENEATINSVSGTDKTSFSVASGGASFDANDLIVIQTPAGVAWLESVSSANADSIYLNDAGLDYAVASGYKVYEMTLIGKIPVGNATLSYNSDVAVVAGQKDSPLLIVLGGNAACAINFASGHYK